MSDPFVSRVGGVLSADIAVPEHEREVRFYSRVLTTGECPLWREDLMNSRGLPVVGLGPRSAEYDHLPLQWMPHIQVADVAASAKRALELGGVELMLDGSGQWAVLLDPNGAAFGIIPVVPADAIPASDDTAGSTGHIAGIELTVPDAAAARDFYREVVGWSVRDVQKEAAGESHTDYEMLGADGQPAAVLRHARGVNSGLPSVWLLQLPVADCPSPTSPRACAAFETREGRSSSRPKESMESPSVP
jgi:predicted enzyme related to lactoylglutathione lyase